MILVIRFTIHVSRFTNICRGLVVATLVLLAIWIAPDLVSAQIAPSPLPPPILPLPTPLPKELPKPEPPMPSILPPAPVPAPRGPMPTVRVYVREILVLGSTVFTPQELAQVTDPYRNREITSEDIESLRVAMTLLYVRHGYSTSGTLVPDQAIVEGLLTLQVIEGTLSRINVEGNYWFRSSYFTSRLQRDAGPPVNVNALQQRLQLFQTDPRIERINAELRPGETRGESVLNLRVADRRPIKAWLEYNNFSAPGVGSNRVMGTIVDENLLGFGDRVSVQYGQSFGIDANAHGSGIIPNLNVNYVIPFTPYDTTFAVDYRRTDFTVIDSNVKALDINGKFELIGFTLRQPVFRTLSQEFALALSGQSESFRTSLLENPFEFQSGSTNGLSQVSALRFAQEYVHRTQDQVISGLSRMSFGLPVLGATVNSGPDQATGEFFSWLGQTQLVRRLNPTRVTLLARADLQLANKHLFLMEQMAVGGRYSVRGYREFTQLGDNVFLGSLETRIPVYTSAIGEELLYLVPFFDYGRAWNTNTVVSPTPEWLGSVGVGTIWNFWRGSRFEVYWGQRLNPPAQSHHTNLQDYGVHVQLVVQAF
ncbi:MAG TPA: ShlB/FhaC/HecB family hemolysin secretion/activation protein [Nitrospiraceae bacterium]|nr:ShlB/FhaC/HecB family hemolysin secretion/activation protein [Nitrospiraceae bacterium]